MCILYIFNSWPYDWVRGPVEAHPHQLHPPHVPPSPEDLRVEVVFCQPPCLFRSSPEDLREEVVLGQPPGLLRSSPEDLWVEDVLCQPPGLLRHWPEDLRLEDVLCRPPGLLRHWPEDLRVEVVLCQPPGLLRHCPEEKASQVRTPCTYTAEVGIALPWIVARKRVLNPKQSSVLTF